MSAALLRLELELAVRAARAAGDIAMRYFGTRLDVAYKSANQPVTAADIEIDAALRALLLADRPGYGWLSEESADTTDRLGRDRVWVVDPIDGTRSFVAGRPEFAISIGLVEAGAAVVGVVYNPATAELYAAVRGGGAFRLGERTERVHVRAAAAAPVVLASRAEIRAGTIEGWAGGWTVRPFGSTAYKLARVGAGMADAFVSSGEKSEWDVCAGALIVAEAGGLATDGRGAAFLYNREDPRLRGVIAAGESLHAELLDRAGQAAARQQQGGTA